MSEIEQLKNGQKNPIETATNKLREALQKDAQAKIDAQVKKTIDACKIAKNEKAELQRLIGDFENEKANLKDLLGDLS